MLYSSWKYYRVHSCMTSLPASIESYLLEAGFSATEVLVLKRLLEEEAMTLRELAAKTGKSTGVLDQATKKLSDKSIVVKENINGSPKCTLSSLDAIRQWMEKDMNQKKDVLHRKKQDFDAFIATVEHEKDRPEMQYFEGLKGLEQAFTKLLEMKSAEWLHFVPALMREEDDPLCEFRVNLFRERRRNKVFMRSIGQDVPLGRRYQSRDIFEYRDSRLVAVEQFPVTFEEFIVGDTVACFDIPNQKASFINYPAMADSQRHMFEMLWYQAECNDDEECAAAVESRPPQEPDLETRVFSGLREFFMSKKSLITFGALGVLSALMTWGMYVNNQSLNFQRMQDRVVAIARTAALEIDTNELSQLQQEEDYRKPAWEKVVSQLKNIKDINSDIIYVYIFRKSEKDPKRLEFIADAASMDPYANFDEDISNDVDANMDGVIEPDGADYLQWPGQDYPNAPDAAFSSFEGLSVSDFYEDQWGKVVSGYAPIFDDKGNVVAVLAVDIKAVMLDELTLQTFSPIYYLLAFFIIFVFIRFAAFHRSLASEVLKLSQTKKALISAGVCSVLALGITIAIYNNATYLNTQRVREQVKAIAATAAGELKSQDIDNLHVEADMNKEVYTSVVKTLDSIRTENHAIEYVYIIRPTAEDGMFELVADSYGLDIDKKIDFNKDGIIGEEDEIPIPGMPYDVSEIPAVALGMVVPSADAEPFIDQWGTFISGFAPIKNAQGVTVAVLGIDRVASDVQKLTLGTFSPIHYFLGFFALLIFVRLAVFHNALLKALLHLSRTRKVLVSLGICSGIALVVTFGMYQYTLNLMKEEIGQRLVSIVATAAPEISYKDLEVVHTEEDMRRPQYQNLFSKLNEIRNSNTDILYSYIMRPTADPEMFEFVADADSNYFLPEDPDDPDAIEVLPPGTSYDANQLAQYDEMERLLVVALSDGKFTTDKWGTYLSASAPVFNKSGVGIAILGVDMDVSDVYQEVNSRFKPYIWFLSIFVLLLILKLFLLHQKPAIQH